MPIDPNISLQVNPVQVQDPYQAYGRMMSLKSLVNAGKLDQIQLREAQMREQQQQQDLTDDEVIRKSYVDAGGDLDQFETLAKQNGASPNALLKVRGLVLDQKTKMQTLSKEERANFRQQSETLAGYMTPIYRATPEERPTLWTTARQQAIAAGHIQEADVPEEYPGDSTFDVMYAGALGQKNYQDVSDKTGQEQRARAGETRAVEDQSRQNQQFMETQYQANRTAHRQENPRAAPVTRTTNLGTFIIDPTEATAQEVRAPGGQPITNQAAGGEGPTAQQRFDWTKSQAGKDALNAGRKEHDELQTEEQKLHSQKIEIGEAVKRLERAAEWKDEKDVNGKVRRVRDPDATYKGIDGKDYEASDEQRRLLEQKLANADREIADLQRRQKNIREQLGVGEFGRQSGTAPLAEVLRNPEAAVAPAQVPQPPAPAPAKPVAPPKPAAKTFPRARLASFAQANRMTEQQAEAELKKQGYTIN